MQVVEEEVLTPLLIVQELVVLEVVVTDQQELDLMVDTEHKTLEVEVAAAAAAPTKQVQVVLALLSLGIK
jgi:hypothetical protein